MLQKVLPKFIIILFIYIILFQSTQLVKEKKKRYKKRRNRNKTNYCFNIFQEKSINKKFINEFNYKTKVIASFTSHRKRLKIKAINQMVDSLLNQTIKPYKIILTLYINDINYINSYLKSLIENDILELLISYEDIKPHKKYFYVMQKFRDYPIITFDDDIIYENTTIESLINSYIIYPNLISARRVHKMLFKKNNNTTKKLLPYRKWIQEYNKELNPSFDLFATNGAGSLFPPNILNITNDLLKEIYKIINADDIYLKYLEIKKGIKTVYVPNNKPMGIQIKNKEYQKTALYKKNVKKNENDIYISLFNIIYNDENF